MNKLKIDFTFNNKQYKLSIDVCDEWTPRYLEGQMSLCGRYELDVRPIDLLCTYRQYLSLPTLHPLNAEELQAAQAKEDIYNVVTLENSCSVDESFFKMIQKDILLLLLESDTLAEMIARKFLKFHTTMNSDFNALYISNKYDIPAIFESFESEEFRSLFTAFNIYIEQNK